MAKRNGIISVCDPNGMHARPAGQLVGALRTCGASATLSCGEKTADGTKLISVMALGAPCGAKLHVTLDGDPAAADRILAFCAEHPAFTAEFPAADDTAHA